MKKNMESKLKYIGFPPSVSQEFISDVLVNILEGHMKKVLLVLQILLSLILILLTVKMYGIQGKSNIKVQVKYRFFKLFVRHCGDVVHHTMLKDVRLGVSLGFPPSIFTTIAIESLNAALKKKVDHKESEWPQINETMKEYVKGQWEEVIHALSGHGQYRVTEEYTHLEVLSSEVD